MAGTFTSIAGPNQPGQSVTATYAAQAAAANQVDFGIPVIGHKTVTMFVDYTSNTGSPASFAFDAKIQVSYDGATWADLGSGGISQITAVGQQTITAKTITGYPKLRVLWTLAFTGGTAPKGNFAITLNSTEA